MATWEPWQYAIWLGGSPTLLSPEFNWYWRVQAEADARRVDKIGFTDLQVGNYGLAGWDCSGIRLFLSDQRACPRFLAQSFRILF